jgi:hypothetical protein
MYDFQQVVAAARRPFMAEGVVAYLIIKTTEVDDDTVLITILNKFALHRYVTHFLLQDSHIHRL